MRTLMQFAGRLFARGFRLWWRALDHAAWTLGSLVIFAVTFAALVAVVSGGPAAAVNQLRNRLESRAGSGVAVVVPDDAAEAVAAEQAALDARYYVIYLGYEPHPLQGEPTLLVLPDPDRYLGTVETKRTWYVIPEAYRAQYKTVKEGETIPLPKNVRGWRQPVLSLDKNHRIEDVVDRGIVLTPDLCYTAKYLFTR